jgi:hypothetical protein
VDAIAISTPRPPAMPAIQPSRNARPFERARSEKSIRITAMTGMGLIATPTASGRISPIASPTSDPVAAGLAGMLFGLRRNVRR